MSANLEQIKDRVRKMLRLAADDGAAENEIAVALEGAQYLIAKYQLSDDDLSATEEELRTPEEVASEQEYGTAKSYGSSFRSPTWQGQLAMVIARFVGTVGVYRQTQPEVHRKPTGIVANDGQAVRAWVFFGPHDDCILASELHQELMLTCATTAKLKYGGELVKGPGRDYCDGFVSGLGDKVDAAKQAVKKEALRITGQTTQPHESRALTVVDVERANAISVAKRNRADEWLKKEQGIRLHSRTSYSRSVGDSGAYGEGKADGQSQSLTKTRTAKIGQR